MDGAWDALEVHTKALKKRMARVGITKPSRSEQEMLRLNVGGSQFHFVRTALEGRGHLGILFESAWDKMLADKMLPRDAGGCIVLDLSPKCTKYVVHTVLNASGAASGTAQLAPCNVLPEDKRAYLPYVASALGLEELVSISTVLEPYEFGPMRATLLDWCPGKPSGLELVYRASRDGWAPRAFHSRCGDESPSTITLYRVLNTGRGTRDSVVGGFSSAPWTPGRRSSLRSSPGAFLFMLKDGTRTQSTPFQPVKWGIDRICREDEIFCGSKVGPCSGRGDLRMTDGHSRSPYELQAFNRDYRIPDDSPFLSLHGHDVVEMETFRVCYPKTTASLSPPKPGLIEIPTFDATTTLSEGGRDEDIRSFGQAIAESLTEEKMALHQARKTLVEANAKAAASVNALAAVYGPHVAAGKKDDVIDLNVRGTRMTTLRSTLQVCPESALATRFDKDKWAPTPADLDERGRWVVDCSPSAFSKVLDVLRMRKREAWPATAGSDWDDVEVEVKASDREEFETYVDMQFPGCEYFIMDFVADNPNDSTAGSSSDDEAS